MNEEPGVTMKVYDPSMAARLADMFNSFNEIWPGGFGGGSPYDPQRVHDWLDHSSAIADLIALDREGNPVGYCGLYPHPRERTAAYISRLGVCPHVLGKKVGKALLLQALKIASARGIRRVDLHTWSGNLRALPLYKKAGFFWVPGSSVYMQDYLSGLFQIPLAREWFSRHPDWYNCFKRDITQAPDEFNVDGMRVYTYTFEAGNDRLCAQVDRYGWGFSSIEQVLDGKRIAVQTRLHSHEIFIGIPNALTIEITNETGEDLPITFAVQPFKGLQWKEPFPVCAQVRKGERITITRWFVVDRTVPVFKSMKMPSEVITSALMLGDQPLELTTGGKIQPAVTINSQTPYKAAPPQRETTVYLNVINNTSQSIEGKIDIRQEERKRGIGFTLSPREVSGIEVPVTVGGPSSVSVVRAVPSLTYENTAIEMPSFEYAVVADCKDLAAVVEVSAKDEVAIVTDVFSIRVEREGGRVNISPRISDSEDRIDVEVGPPFGLSLDRSLTFDYEVAREGRYLTMVLTANSLHLPGICIKKYLRVAPGVHEVEFWYTLTNTSTTPLHAAGKLTLGGGEGISIDLMNAKKRVYTPLGRRVIESDPSTHMVSGTMVPQDPAYWEESWTAAEYLNRSGFSGWIWSPEHVRKISVSAGSLDVLESEPQAVAPGDVCEPAHLWYVLCSSLPEVRMRWNQLVGGKEIPEHFSLPVIPPVYIRLARPPILERGKRARMSLRVCHATSYPLPGELTIGLPPGWGGSFLTTEGKSESVLMPEKESSLEVELSPPDTDDPSAVFRVHFHGEFDMDFSIPLLLVSGDVRVEDRLIDGHGVKEVSNGVITFTVVTEAGGNLIRLTDSQGRTFFTDTYPEVKAHLFFSRYIGGMQPGVFFPTSEDPFTAPEKTQAHVVEDGLWKGVRVSWTEEAQELLRGQHYSLTYLTLPGSPLVRMVLENENPAQRVVKWIAHVVADVKIGGSMEGTVLTVPGGTGTWVRNWSPTPFIGPAQVSDPWAHLAKGDQSLLLFVPESSPGMVMALDITEAVMGIMVAERETGPGGKSAVSFAFAVNQPRERVAELRKALKVEHVNTVQ